MKTRCHNCGASASLDMLVSTNAAGRAFAAAFNVPAPLAPLAGGAAGPGRRSGAHRRGGGGLRPRPVRPPG